MAGNNSTFLTENSTASGFQNVRVWNAAAILSVVVTAVSLLTNGSVLLVLVSHRALWTSFSVYIMSLLTANITYDLVNGPLDVINDLYASWWLGRDLCTLYQYAQWVINGVQVYSHVLIALNGLWAIIFPFSYKNYHGFSVAVPACVGAWVSAHIINLPILVLDHLYYRPSEETNGCLVDTTTNYGQKVGGLITEFITVMVVFVIFAQYPFAWWRHVASKKLRSVKIVPMASGQQPSGKEVSKTVTTAVSSGIAGGGSTSTNTRKLKRADYSQKRRTFVLLTVMTLSILIFWTPSIVYYSMLEFVDVYQPEIYTTVMVLFECQSAIDPLVFVFSLKELRAAVFQVYGLRSE